MELSIHPDADRLALAAARAITEALSAAGTDRCSLGLAGGSTPRATYTHLRIERIEWERVDLWLTDERWVPWTDDDSNGKMAMETLVQPAGATLARPRWSRWIDADESAVFYEANLRDLHPGRLPDVVLLGMGTDGHTASLFPSTSALVDPQPGRWFVANEVPVLGAWRLTATPWLLQNAGRVIVLVTGHEKARVLKEVLEGPPDVYPIQILAHATGEVTLFADEAAASELTGR